MNRKQLLILVVLLVIVGGVALLINHHNSSSWSPPQTSTTVLGDFSFNDVAKVVIQSGTNTLTLEKKNDKWVVPARDDYPADFSRVAGFIQSLWQLKPSEDVEAGPSQLGRLGLLPPGKDEGDGTLVDLQDKDGKRIAALMVGKKRLQKSPQVPDQEGYPVGCYVMPAGSNPPKISLVSDTMMQADASPAAWLDKSFLHIDRIQSVTLSSAANQWTLSRDTDGGDEWKLSGIKPGESVNQGNVPPFVETFSAPQFSDVMTAADKQPELNTSVMVTTFDQFTYMFKFGMPIGDNLPVSVAVTGTPPATRTPGKDEKAEDKKRLDEEFTANTKKLADSLAKAKEFASRVYLVPSATFNPLFKSRADLVAPPAAAPGPGASMAPSLEPVPSVAPSPSPAASETPKPSATPKASATPKPKSSPKKSPAP